MNTIRSFYFLIFGAFCFVVVAVVPSESLVSTIFAILLIVSVVGYFIHKRYIASKVDIANDYTPKNIDEAQSGNLNRVDNKSLVQEQMANEKRINYLKNKYSVYVAGTSYRQNNIKIIIKKMLEIEEFDKYENLSNKEILDYGSTVYEYPVFNIPTVKLEHEPTNEYDPNAIKVLVEVGENESHHIGYIPSEELDLVNDWLNEGLSYYVEIKGGKYKEVEYDLEQDKEIVSTINSNYRADLYFVDK